MVVVYDNVQTSGDWTYNFKLHQETLYTLSQQTYGIVDFCWDGFCATESLYNSYDENDVRRKSWILNTLVILIGASGSIVCGSVAASARLRHICCRAKGQRQCYFFV